jgi:four helix bundle protein
MSGTRIAEACCMTPITSFRDLEVWQRSIDLVEACYRITASLPRDERFGLGNQMRRATVSISANIAEGHRRTRRAYLNHLSIALGSHAEFETYVEIIRRLGLIEEILLVKAETLQQSVGELLHGLVRSLER